MRIEVEHKESRGNRCDVVPTTFLIIDDDDKVVDTYSFMCAAGDEDRWWNELYEEYCAEK